MVYLTKNQIFALLLALGLIVLLFFAPSKLRPKAPEAEVAEEVQEPVTIDDAVKLITEGIAPMKGILRLREISEEDPSNIEAAYYLGVFSLQSGQYDKGVGRMEHVLELDSTHQTAHYFLGICFGELGENEKSRTHLKKFIAGSSDEKMRAEAEKYINELKN